MSNTHAVSIISGQYENKAFRFAIYPNLCDRFANFPFLETDSIIKKLTVHKDGEGMLRASNRSVKFLYRLPTGDFTAHLSKSHIFFGNVQTGKFGDPSLKIQLQNEDQIFGFGAANGNPDRNDATFQLLNIDTLLFLLKENSYSSFPFFMIKRANVFFGILVNSVLPFIVFSGIKKDEEHQDPVIQFKPIQKESSSIAWDLVFFSGTPAEILKQYSDLTGKPFLPPLWSLGLHQSRWSYKTTDKVLEIANRYNQEQIPCDAIHLDIHYMDRYRIFTWHPKRFGDPQMFHKKLQKMEFRSVAIVDPGISVAAGYSIYKECMDKLYFCFKQDKSPYIGHVWPGKTIFPDFTRQDVRDWWSKKHDTLFEAGVSGIWNDMNDPAFKMGRNIDPLAEDIYHKGFTHLQVRNYYANLEAQSTQKAFSIFKPKERSFILTRSATCGIQSQAALWTGDNLSKWSHLRENLNMVLNLGLSGVPFSGSDIGGFAGGLPLPGLLKILKFKKNKELFARWIELGSLMPFFRIHTAIFSFDQEPWSFGNDVLNIARKHIRRRYRLLPYIYNLFYDSTISGAPVVRHLFYEFPNSKNDLPLDQFMLGSSILVCPVLDKKQNTKKVVLPDGNWYEYESGEKYKGNSEIEIDITPGYYPLFIKAGTALPVWNSALSSSSSQSGPLIWEIYPSEKISGTVVLDNGITEIGDELEMTRILIEGTLGSSGDLEIRQKFIEKKYLQGIKDIKIRLPSDYRQMFAKNIKTDYRNANLIAEDRLFKMNEFDLPMGNAVFTFAYKSRSFL